MGGGTVYHESESAPWRASPRTRSLDAEHERQGVGGSASSPELTVTPGACDTTPNGGADGFLIRID